MGSLAGHIELFLSQSSLLGIVTISFRLIICFVCRGGPFDALDFILFFQGVLQSFVDRHGEAIGIFAEGEAKKLALKITRLRLVLKLENEKAAIAVFGNVVVSDRLLVVDLDTVTRYLKRIALSICPITEVGCFCFFFFGSRDSGDWQEHDREKR